MDRLCFWQFVLWNVSSHAFITGICVFKKKERKTTLLILAMIAMTRSDPGNTRHKLECKERVTQKAEENHLNIF